MHGKPRPMMPLRTAIQRAVLGFAVITPPTTCLLLSCVPFADCGASFKVRGRTLDQDSQQPLSNAIVGGRTFTNGAQTGLAELFTPSGTVIGEVTDAVGGFSLPYSTGIQPCPPQPYPRPDQVEIIVALDGCEQSFLIDINENTVVDITFPDDVLELKDPIQVPPCPTETAP